jgi:hypothetical protein
MNSERSGGSEDSPSEPYTPRDRFNYKIMVGVLLGVAAVASCANKMLVNNLLDPVVDAGVVERVEEEAEE